MFFRNYLIDLWHRTADWNNQNLAALLEFNPKAKFLDLGCDDGKLIKERVEKYVGSRNIWGIDINRKVLVKAKNLGLKTYCQDLNFPLPFPDNFFDVVNANQIIEHLWNNDKFLTEIYRVLKKNGYFLLSTENLASWHNLVALFCGFQPPSSDISSFFRPWNFFSVCCSRPQPWVSHQRVFTIYGICQLLKNYKFKIEAVKTAGYYPLPVFLAKIMVKIDPIHSAFICLKLRK